MNHALASVSPLQLVSVWEDLLSAEKAVNGFGGDTCEIYMYRVMPFTPSVVSLPNSEQTQEAYTVANHALVQICQMFEFEHNVRIVFKNGTAWIPIEQLTDLYLETHRLHLRVLKNE